MVVDLLHFPSFLSVSTFLVFAVVVFLRLSLVLVSLTLPSVGLGFLRWTESLPLSCLCGWEQWSWRPGFPQVWRSLFPSSSFRLVTPFVPGGGGGGNFGTFFLFIFYIMVSVFFPHFCTGLLLRVAVTCGGIYRMEPYSTRSMVFTFLTDTVHLT